MGGARRRTFARWCSVCVNRHDFPLECVKAQYFATVTICARALFYLGGIEKKNRAKTRNNPHRPATHTPIQHWNTKVCTRVIAQTWQVYPNSRCLCRSFQASASATPCLDISLFHVLLWDQAQCPDFLSSVYGLKGLWMYMSSNGRKSWPDSPEAALVLETNLFFAV